jgi:hypothetical protein
VSVVRVVNNLYVAGYTIVLDGIVPGIHVVSIATENPTALEEISEYPPWLKNKHTGTDSTLR